MHYYLQEDQQFQNNFLINENQYKNKHICDDKYSWITVKQ